jgi:hypothetical protein
MLSIRRLIWDEWNVAHIARHNVVPQEVEDVCHSDPLVQQGKKGRVVLVGPTAAGRVLEVVLDPEGRGVYYPVTAFPASRKDRALYQQHKGGGTP